MGFNEKELFFVGDKGIAFYDQEGNLKKETEIKKIQSALWNESYIFLFTKDETYAIPFSDLSNHGQLPITPFDDDVNILFSESAEYMITLKDEKEMAFYKIGN